MQACAWENFAKSVYALKITNWKNSGTSNMAFLNVILLNALSVLEKSIMFTRSPPQNVYMLMC